MWHTVEVQNLILPGVDAFDIILFAGPVYYILILSIYHHLKNVHFIHFLIVVFFFLLLIKLNYFPYLQVIKEYFYSTGNLIYGIAGLKIAFISKKSTHSVFLFYTSQVQLFYKQVSFLFPFIMSISVALYFLLENYWGIFFSVNLIAVLFYYTGSVIFTQKHPFLDE
jgi:hypothetical protein